MLKPFPLGEIGTYVQNSGVEQDNLDVLPILNSPETDVRTYDSASQETLSVILWYFIAVRRYLKQQTRI